MKKLILLVLILFSILCVNALSADEEKSICDKFFFFLVESGGDYSQSDLQNLKGELSVNLSIEEISNYLENYIEICEPLNGRSLPYGDTDYGLESEFPDCETDLAYEIFGYNLDWSIPFFKVYFGRLDCESVDKYKWFFNLKNQGEEIYLMTGIKFWPLFLLLFVIFIAWFVVSNSRVNSRIRKFSKSETSNNRFINEENQIEYIEK